MRAALVGGGLMFVVGLYPFVLLYPAGFRWGDSPYLAMIIALCATLGVFLLRAARAPQAHASLIWFTVWSSAVHAAVMAVQAVVDPAHRDHLLGDVPALMLVAVVLAGSGRARPRPAAPTPRRQGLLKGLPRARHTAPGPAGGGAWSSSGPTGSRR